MMKKSKHKLSFSLRLLAVVSSLALIFFACSSPEENAENSSQKAIVNTEQVFVVVEQMPEFVGGKQAMYKYLQENIKYPELAKKVGTQGTVSVGFVIEKDGKINSIAVLKGIGNGCDEEAKRIIKNMPNWNTGQQKGKIVSVAYTLPIKFNLQ